MKKKKICFLSLAAYPLFKVDSGLAFGGGSELQLYLLAKELANKKEYEVSFIVADYGQQDIILSKNVTVRKVKGFEIGGQRTFLKTLKLIRKTWQLMKKIDADIYQIRAAGPEVGLMAFFCRLHGKKMIYMTASDIDVDGRYIKSNFLAGFFYKYGLTHANEIIYQTKNQQKTLDFPGSLIRNSMPSYIEKLEATRKYFLWVGTAQPLKQAEKFLEVAAAMPSKDFVMILLLHHSKNKDYFDSIIESAKRVTNLKIIPGVEFDKIAPFFSKAKALINTSEYEGYPNTFVQAFSTGTPVATLGINPDNILGDNNLGYVAENTTDLKKFLEQLESNKKLFLNISKNTKKFFNDNHSIDNNIELITNIYDKLLFGQKILISAPYASALWGDSDQRFGGAEVQLSLIARELSQNGWNVVLILGDSNPNLKTQKNDGVEVVKYLKLPGYKLIGFLDRLFRYYKLIKKTKPDFVFTSSFSSDVGILAFLCKIFKVKFIYRISSTIEANKAVLKKKPMIDCWLYNWGLKKTDLILCQTEEIKTDLRNFYKLNSSILPNGYKIRNSTNTKRTHILWVGSARELKHPEIFVELADKMPKEKFVMVMPLPDAVPDWLIPVLEKIRKTKNLKFIPGVKFNKIDDYFKNAKLFINTSDFEGYPNTFVQSCVYGVPIVSYKINPSEILTKYNFGLACDGSFNKLVENSRKLLNNSILYKEFSKNSNQYGLKIHNLEKMTKHLIKLLLNTKRRKS